MTATYYLLDKILDLCCGSSNPDIPSSQYIGMCASCDVNGTITGEPTIGASGYSRVVIDNDKITWSGASDGILINNILIQFPEATSNWGVKQVIFVTDAPTEPSNVLFYGELGYEYEIIEGSIISFATGDIIISIS